MFFAIQPQSNPVLSIQNVNQITLILGQNLQPGQTLQAVVQSFDPVHQQAVIRTSNQTLTALTQLPLIEGQNLTLLIESVEPQVILRLLNTNQQLNLNQIRIDPNLSQQQIQSLLQNLVQDQFPQQSINSSSNQSAPKILPPDLLQYFLPLIKDADSSQQIKQLIRIFNQPVEGTLAKLLKGQPIVPKEVFQDPVSLIRQFLSQQTTQSTKPAAVKNLISTLIQSVPLPKENPQTQTNTNLQQAITNQSAQNSNTNINSQNTQTPLESVVRQFFQLIKNNTQPQAIQIEIENLLSQFTKQKPDVNVIRQVVEQFTNLKSEIAANPKVQVEPHVKAILESAIYQTVAKTGSVKTPALNLASIEQNSFNTFIKTVFESVPAKILSGISQENPAIDTLIKILANIKTPQSLNDLPKLIQQPENNFKTSELQSRAINQIINTLKSIEQSGLQLKTPTFNLAKPFAQTISNQILNLIPQQILTKPAVTQQLINQLIDLQLSSNSSQTNQHIQINTQHTQQNQSDLNQAQPNSAVAPQANLLPKSILQLLILNNRVLQQLTQSNQQQVPQNISQQNTTINTQPNQQTQPTVQTNNSISPATSNQQPLHPQVNQIQQLLNQVQGNLISETPVFTQITQHLQNWIDRYPAEVISQPPKNLPTALPLHQEAVSELKVILTLLSTSLTIPQLVQSNPQLQLQIFDSVDALLNQLFSIKVQPEPNTQQAQQSNQQTYQANVQQSNPQAVEQLTQLKTRITQIVDQLRSGQTIDNNQRQNLKATISEALRLVTTKTIVQFRQLDFTGLMREFSDSLENFRFQNLQAQETGKPLQLLLPILGPGAFTLAEIKVLKQQQEEKEKQETNSYNLLIVVELKNTGPLKFEIHVNQRKLTIMLTCAKLIIKRLVDQNSERLKDAIRETGFELAGFNCVFDSGLKVDQQNQSESISYRKVRYQV